MHFVTSNFNNLHTNKIWKELKNVYIDEDYNNFYLKLNNKFILNQYKTFHVLIYLDINNAKKTLALLEEILIRKSNKKKNIFFYIFKFNEIKPQNNHIVENEILNFQKKISNYKKNLFLKIFLKLEKDFFNLRNKKHIKFPFDISAIKEFCKYINDNLKIFYSKPFKLIILDCDNTLWGGILDEDKIEGVTYGDTSKGIFFKNFQKKLLQLKKEGFILSISSKNNEHDVWNVMRHKKMILQKKDFLNPKINWNEKYINIRKIISELSLRAADTLFIDDNILEILKVKKLIKNISYIHIDNILNVEKKIENNLRLKKLLILEEDLKKNKQYKIRADFKNFESKNKNNPSFFKSLKQKVKFYNCNKSNFNRALQLFNKTNQFNFSLKRFDQQELQKIMIDKKYEIRLFDLKDKFGDHGIIGIYVLKKVDCNNIEILDFNVSCRVFNRFVENYVIFIIANKYKNKNILIKYNKTNLNNKIIPIFLKSRFFEFKNRKKKMYVYKLITNAELYEVKKYFN